jgi:class 3 adenylate cyclase
MTDLQFPNEESVLNYFQELVTSDQQVIQKVELEALLAQYSKLAKNLSRMIRISDKNENRLQNISSELNAEKKKMEAVADQLSRYLPSQVYKSIFAGDHAVEIKTKRKLLTVFFSDIKGFTEISSNLQPEVLTYYINKYFSALSDVAIRHGATIDKFIGDAMMIFFGDPESKGDKEDALACVRMAVEMQAQLSKLNAEWAEEGLQYPLLTRIGINTGWCNVGNFGSADRMAYTIIGGEVNLAARLESQCQPTGVLISGETFGLVQDFVDVEEKESVTLKGINRPVRTYSVRRLLDGSEKENLPINLDIPGHKQVHVNTPELSLPDRLAFIANLRRALLILEGPQSD